MKPAESELKPCPFCGHKIRKIDVGGSIAFGADLYYYIYCGRCGLTMRFENKDTLIKHWNQRHNEEA